MNENFFNAFKTGIDKESEAIDFYRNLAKEADDIETKNFLKNSHLKKTITWKN